MSKERLEEIKKIMKDIKELHKKHDQRQADNAKCYLVEKYGDWIISTVEGQQKEIESYQMRYENTGSIFSRQTLQSRIAELEEENARLRKALERVQNNYPVLDVDYVPVEMLYEIQLIIKKALEGSK